MRISIIGCGNIGVALGAVFSNYHDVLMYTKKIIDKNSQLIAYDADNNTRYSSKSLSISSNLEYAIDFADIIVVTYPPNIFLDFSKSLISLNVFRKCFLFVPGAGGVEFIFKKSLIDRGAIILGLARVPAVYRITKENKESTFSGLRKEGLLLASIPAKFANAYSEIVSDLFKMPCKVLPNFLSITLTPSNNVLHTSRLYSFLKNKKKDILLKEPPLFYGEFDIETCKILLMMDDELSLIKQKLNRYLDISKVESIRSHYEAKNENELLIKITSISSLHNLTFPLKQNEGRGYNIDYSSRYFVADFPYGLNVLLSIASLLKVDAKTMREAAEWYFDSKSLPNILQENGIFTIDCLIDLYR